MQEAVSNAGPARPRLGTGGLLAGTFAQLAAIPGPLALYFGCFAMLGALGSLSGPAEGLAVLLSLPGYVVGQFLLYRRLLDRGGLVTPGTGYRVFRFAGMIVALGLPITIGLNIFFLPGLLLVAKWIMAPAFLVAGPRGTFDSMGASWNASDGNTLPIALAAVVLVLGWVVLFVMGVAVADARGWSQWTRAVLVLGFLFQLLPLLLMGLSVSAYARLTHAPERLGEVFA